MKDDFSPNLTFEITDSKLFLQKLLEEYNDFDKEYLNPRYALNCALNSWHLTDWTYQEFFKDDSRFQDSTEKTESGSFKITGLTKYQNLLIEICEELKYMRLISNGAKHCVLNKKVTQKTGTKIGDYMNGDFNRFDYDTTRFVIENENGEKIGFERALLKTIEFWKSFIDNPKSYT